MYRFLIAILFLTGAAGARAGTFTLESAVAHALRHNPDLAAARFGIGEAQGRLQQAGRLPNPELESEFRPNVRGREYSFGVGFVQKFPLTDRLRLERTVHEAHLAAATAEVAAAERRLAEQVRTIGVRLLGLKERRALKDRQVANSRELAASARQLADRGEGSALEAAGFDMEARQLSLEVLQLDAARAALSGEARPLLGVAESEPVDFAGGLPLVGMPAAAAVDVAARPDYRAARARTEAARQGVPLAKAGRWEDLGVGLNAEIERAEDAPDGLDTDGIVGIRFSLPLPFWNRNDGAIREAEAAAARTGREADALAASIRAAAAAARAEMAAARRIVDEIDRVLLPAARAFEQQTTSFLQEGQPGAQPSDVLRAREKRLALEMARIEALESLHLARVRHLAALGK